MLPVLLEFEQCQAACRGRRQAAGPCKIMSSISATCRLLDYKQRYKMQHIRSTVESLSYSVTHSLDQGFNIQDTYPLLYAENNNLESQRRHIHTQPYDKKEQPQEQQRSAPDASLTTAAPAGIASSSPLPSSPVTPALGSPTTQSTSPVSCPLSLLTAR